MTSTYVRACPTCKEQHLDWEVAWATQPGAPEASAFPQPGFSQG